MLEFNPCVYQLIKMRTLICLSLLFINVFAHEKQTKKFELNINTMLDVAGVTAELNGNGFKTYVTKTDRYQTYNYTKNGFAFNNIRKNMVAFPITLSYIYTLRSGILIKIGLSYMLGNSEFKSTTKSSPSPYGSIYDYGTQTYINKIVRKGTNVALKLGCFLDLLNNDFIGISILNGFMTKLEHHNSTIIKERIYEGYHSQYKTFNLQNEPKKNTFNLMYVGLEMCFIRKFNKHIAGNFSMSGLISAPVKQKLNLSDPNGGSLVFDSSYYLKGLRVGFGLSCLI